jgi:hypothetical protein
MSFVRQVVRMHYGAPGPACLSGPLTHTEMSNAEFTGAGAEGGGYQHWPWPVLASACNAQLARATAPEVV